MLDVGDRQRLYWEQCGRSDGEPALVLHGGPGSGCAAWMRQLFNPDLERLREHLRIERWVVYGLSWGCSLALAYAQTHPERVLGMVLQAVTMTRRCDVEWLTLGVRRFFPQQWRAFRDGLPEQLLDENLAAGYAELLASPDAAVRERAARYWCDWEDALVSPQTGGRPSPRYADPCFRLGFARLVTHYFAHAAWLEEDQLCTTHTGWTASVAYSSTASSTWPDPRTLPGSSTRRGPAANSSSSRQPGTPTSQTTASEPSTGSPRASIPNDERLSGVRQVNGMRLRCCMVRPSSAASR